MRVDDHLAARDRILGNAIAGKIEGTSLARHTTVGRPVLRMDRAHTRHQAGGADRDPIADSYRAGEYGAGYHRAGAG
jgi:hypothetical protein